MDLIISIRRVDKTGIDQAHDRIYGQLDPVLAPHLGCAKVTHNNATDTKFFITELSDNFLQYDEVFHTATIELSISVNLDVVLKVRHDGNDFDPLADSSTCHNIKRAAARLTVSKGKSTLGERVSKTMTIKYSLRSGAQDV